MRQFQIIESIPQPKATEQIRAIKRLPRRVKATNKSAVVMVAAGAAERDGKPHFVAPVNRYGMAVWAICGTLQAAVDTALMHHLRATVYEVATDRAITSYTIEAA